MACGANNRLAQLATKVGAGGAVDFSTGATGHEFLNESLTASGEILYSQGIRGTRSMSVNQARRGVYTIDGAINFNPSPQAVREWYELALGDLTNNVITPTETLPVFAVMVDKVSDVFRYGDCKVGSIVLRGGGPGFLDMTVNLIGRSYSGVATSLTFPSITLGTDEEHAPFVFSDLVLTIDSTAYEVGSFELTVDNALQSITRNAQYAGCLREGERVVTLNANVPSTSAALSALDEPALTGLAGEIALTNGDVGATIDLPVLQKSRNDPNVAGQGEQQWDLSFRAVTDASNANEIEITSDVDGPV